VGVSEGGDGRGLRHHLRLAHQLSVRKKDELGRNRRSEGKLALRGDGGGSLVL